MDEKQSRIVKAATLLFAKYGLRKTTVSEIASAADVGKGTIYTFFDTKEALFSAVVRREGDELLRGIRAAVRKVKSAEDKLRTLILTRFEIITELWNIHGITTAFLAEAHPEIESARQEYFLQERALIESILEEGVEQGELRIDDVPLVGVTISAALQALEAPWIFEGRELRLERKVDALLRLFVFGMKQKK